MANICDAVIQLEVGDADIQVDTAAASAGSSGDEARNLRRMYNGNGGLPDPKVSSCAALSARALYLLISCQYCKRVFDADENIPRALMCGHSCCTVCLGVCIRSASKKMYAVKCPCCGSDTPAVNNQVTSLAPAHGTLALLHAQRAAGPLPFRVHVKNLAGDMLTIIALPDFPLANIRAQLFELNNIYVEHLQRLVCIGEDGRQVEAFDDYTEPLQKLGICNESLLHVVMLDDFAGGKYVEYMDFDKNVVPLTNQLQCSVTTCVTRDGNVFWVGDICSRDVKVWSRVEKRVLCTIKGFAWPEFLCLSHDGTRLFVADSEAGIVYIHDTTSERVVRIGQLAESFREPRGVCTTPDDKLLLVADDQCVHVFDARTGTPMRKIGACGSGKTELQCAMGICLSPDGERLFVADHHNRRVQVFRVVDGAHERTIGTYGCGGGFVGFFQPRSLHISPCGEWLFVSDHGLSCVQVMRASNGDYMHPLCCKYGSGSRADFDSARDIWSHGNEMYVADMVKQRIHIFLLDNRAY